MTTAPHDPSALLLHRQPGPSVSEPVDLDEVVAKVLDLYIPAAEPMQQPILSKAEQRAVLAKYLHERKYRQLMRTEK